MLLQPHDNVCVLVKECACVSRIPDGCVGVYMDQSNVVAVHCVCGKLYTVYQTHCPQVVCRCFCSRLCEHVCMQLGVSVLLLKGSL